MKAPQLIDISPAITPALGVFPGDVPFSRKSGSSFANGDSLELSSMHTTLHLGAHTDGPIHYRAGLPGIGEQDLHPYFGLCEIVDVSLDRGQRVLPEHCPGPFRAPRVLFRTSSFPDPEQWNEDFCSLSPKLIEALAQSDVILVGLDTPSIDPQADDLLATHQAVADHGMAILEGVVMAHVEPGLYQLCALPLKILGADASPVRAVLWRDEATSS